jgi:hypothetical protein
MIKKYTTTSREDLESDESDTGSCELTTITGKVVPQIHIMINPLTDSQFKKMLGTRSYGRVFEIVDTIMHEMSHAALMIYRCRCSECQQHKKEEIGFDGDGPCWEWLCESILLTGIQMALLRDMYPGSHTESLCEDYQDQDYQDLAI